MNVIYLIKGIWGMNEFKKWTALVTSVVGFITAPLVLADSRQSVRYDLSFENAAQHEATITVTFKGVPGDDLTFRMSRSSPGRYALHEFAKNVYNVSATDGSGKTLDLSRPDPYQWQVSGHDGTVVVSYTLFADRADGTYSQVDRTHAHLNMPATIMWAKVMEKAPISLHFKPLDKSWKVATQLKKTNQPYVFEAPNLYYLMDSPTELSNHDVRSWKVASNGKDYTINLAVHHDGTAEDMDTFAERAKKVVDQQMKVYGELPNYDYGEYTFIADYLPHVSGDGMEHRNSTIISGSTGLQESNFRQLGTLSHEFFHAWNVERIRPKALEPFDFTRANMTNNLWFAEGFTSYYSPLMILRAGVGSDSDMINRISYLVEVANHTPGVQMITPEGASRLAPFVDASTFIDPDNFDNIFLSYYTYGNIMGLALDLEIRNRFPGKSLDDFMALMWKDRGKPEQPYVRTDLRDTLAKLTGDAAFADHFFETYIWSKHVPDFAALLAPAGLIVSQPNLKRAFVGKLRLNFEGTVATVANSVEKGSALYQAGVNKGVEIVKLGNRRIRSQRAWDQALGSYSVGDETTITYIARGHEYEMPITIAGDPSFKVTSLSDSEMTANQKAFRASWFGAK